MKGLVTLIVKVFTCIQEAAKRGTWEPVGNISRMRIWGIQIRLAYHWYH
jgi:hypothetical protein